MDEVKETDEVDDANLSKFRSLSKILEGVSEPNSKLDSGNHTFSEGRRHRSYSISSKPDQKSGKFRSRSLSKNNSRKPSAIHGSTNGRTLRNRRKRSSYNSRQRYNSINNDGANISRDAAIRTGQKSGGLSSHALTMRKFQRSIYWLVHNRREIGFRHICLLLLVLTYTLLGAAIFFNIESRHEHKEVAERKEALDYKVKLFAEQLLQLKNDSSVVIDNGWAKEHVKSAYISLLKDDSLYIGSTYYRSSDPSNFKWTYASAFFFSMNLYTTTGYGSIAPESMLGQACAICYSLLTIPITLVVIRDLGQLALVHLTTIYARTLLCFRRAMGHVEPHEDSMISLPIKFCVALLAGYLLFAAVFVYLFDDWYGDAPHTGLPFFTAFYFSYISLSTIGLGDIMPNNATFHPAISIMFFFGLPVMKVVNRVTYICIENGIFGAFTLLENALDGLVTKIQPLKAEPTTYRPPRKFSRCSACSHINEFDEEDEAAEYLNGLTIRSLATFARANTDVYGGGFGRVNLRKGDLVQSKTSVSSQPSP